LVSPVPDRGQACGVSSRPDLPVEHPLHPAVRARTQVGVSALAGLVAAAPVAAATKGGLYPLIAWDVAALVYLVWVGTKVWKCDAERTAHLAVPEDPTRATADLLALLAAVASLVAVGFVLGEASNSNGAAKTILAGFAVLSIVISWTVVHTIYTLRYARLYYTGADGGITFHDEEPPAYADFAYVSFTIGMTFQVSDTDLETREIRKTALFHALLSFMFATGILASTINLVANL
jgi:uncharacterized membrane protein